MSWLRSKFPDVPTLLAELRKRPGLYLHSKTIRGLKIMLMGIDFAEDFHDIRPQAKFGGFDFEGFEAWVEREHNSGRLTLDSFSLAAYITGSEEEGFELWFRWYDTFNAKALGRIPGSGRA